MGVNAEFSAGLLDPQHPVPLSVKGRTERRYAVYRNNVTVGLIRALEANFPVVRRLLGEQYFAGFAREFAQMHPPESPLMFQYGAHFPAALQKAEDLANYPYLSDVALLEILWRESYHAADVTPLAGDVLASMDPDVLFSSCFVTHPATRLIQSRFAIHDIFSANTSEGEGQRFDPARPQYILITRPTYDVMARVLLPEQFTFFQALKTGENLGQALDRAADINPDFDLPGGLSILLQSGAFQSIQFGNEQTP